MDLSLGVGKAGSSPLHSWTQNVGHISVSARVNRLILLSQIETWETWWKREICFWFFRSTEVY